MCRSWRLGKCLSMHSPHSIYLTHTPTHTHTRTSHSSLAKSRPRAQGDGTVDMAAAVRCRFKGTELGQWVEANPGRVDERDKSGVTPLHAAIGHLNNLSMALWLLERGADVNGRSFRGWTPVHRARSLNILIALLERGADPTVLDDNQCSPLMHHAQTGRANYVIRLLQDPRVRATIDMRDCNGSTSLAPSCLLQNGRKDNHLHRPPLSPSWRQPSSHKYTRKYALGFASTPMFQPPHHYRPPRTIPGCPERC